MLKNNFAVRKKGKNSSKTTNKNIKLSFAKILNNLINVNMVILAVLPTEINNFQLKAIYSRVIKLSLVNNTLLKAFAVMGTDVNIFIVILSKDQNFLDIFKTFTFKRKFRYI